MFVRIGKCYEFAESQWGNGSTCCRKVTGRPCIDFSESFRKRYKKEKKGDTGVMEVLNYEQ